MKGSKKLISGVLSTVLALAQDLGEISLSAQCCILGRRKK